MVQHLPALNRPATPVCSVCIANYNGEALLADCVESVLRQEGGIAVEIIVHDDASDDASVDLLRRLYPQVEVIVSDENVGFCVANNRMVEHARGTFVLLLNNDAALDLDAVSTLAAATMTQDRPGILTLPQRDWESNELVDRGCLLDPFYNPTPNMDPARSEVAMTIGACLWMPRALWQQLGGFPEWLGSIAEDLYLCCVARLDGYSVKVTRSSGYRHRQGASFGGNRASIREGLRTTFRRRYLSERNKTAVMLVCTPTAIIWPLLLTHLVLLALEGATLTVIKRDGHIWTRIYGAAIAHFFRDLGRLTKQRKVLQNSQKSTLRQYLSCFSPIPRKLALLARYGIPGIR
ncbi:glycosyltransferase family 2 protein [Dyella japonica]|uniref:GT2 family glycosyltransferase n=1 Tax=Dyella japonica TaxID=231455 RepID=A0ABV2JXN7_9GAMM